MGLFSTYYHLLLDFQVSLRNNIKLFFKHFRKGYQKYTLTPIESYCRITKKNNNLHHLLLGFKILISFIHWVHLAKSLCDMFTCYCMLLWQNVVFESFNESFYVLKAKECFYLNFLENWSLDKIIVSFKNSEYLATLPLINQFITLKPFISRFVFI